MNAALYIRHPRDAESETIRLYAIFSNIYTTTFEYATMQQILCAKFHEKYGVLYYKTQNNCKYVK